MNNKDGGHNTLTNTSSSFSAIQENTHCIFAKKAKIMLTQYFQRDWEKEVSQVNSAISYLEEFCKICNTEEYDGLAFEFSYPEAGDSITALSKTVKILLSILASIDNSATESLKKVTEPNWWFTYHDIRFFIVSFAPFYSSKSPRFTYGSRSTFILFQPVESFERRANNIEKRIDDRTFYKIRKNFSKNNQSYNLSLAASPLESHKVVWPENLNDPAVEWWLVN